MHHLGCLDAAGPHEHAALDHFAVFQLEALARRRGDHGVSPYNHAQIVQDALRTGDELGR